MGLPISICIIFIIVILFLGLSEGYPIWSLLEVLLKLLYFPLQDVFIKHLCYSSEILWISFQPYNMNVFVIP